MMRYSRVLELVADAQITAPGIADLKFIFQQPEETLVNKVGHDSPDCIVEAEEEP